MRPVTARHQRRTERLASEAVAVTCQKGRPKRSASRRPTTAASGEGSMVVKPSAAAWRKVCGNCGRAMAEHGAGVAEAEVDVGIAVGIGEVDARGLGDEQAERAFPSRPSSASARRAASSWQSLRPRRRDFGLRWRKRAFSRVSIASTEASVIRRGHDVLEALSILGNLPSTGEGGGTTPMDFVRPRNLV